MDSNSSITSVSYNPNDPAKKDKILFSIPDFYNYYALNLTLLKLMNEQPGMFRDDVVVDSMYGSFPGVIWNAGRTQFGGAPLDNIQATIQGINSLGVSMRFTFTNKYVDSEELFNDHYGNVILQCAHNGMNGVNVSSPQFAGYIKKNYPNYYLLWSTTKGIKDVDEVNALSEDRLIVPPYTMNNTDAVTKFTHPENIELLCCEACIDNCPNRAHHYDTIAKAQMVTPSDPFKCPHGCEHYYFADIFGTRKHHITYDMIKEKYLPLGINKFKISGRNDNIINVIERYVEFFALPEYRDRVRNHLIIDTMMH